jgi:PAS domain S-box-containing protein
MPSRLTCPRGHQWTLREGGTIPPCPVCGLQFDDEPRSAAGFEGVVTDTMTFEPPPVVSTPAELCHESLATAPHGPAAPTATAPVVPGYKILGRIGQGSMGAVYKAVQVSLNRVVALKVIPAARGGDNTQARLRAEAQAVARLQHANIVQVYDSGVCDGGVYLAMEFCGGGRLADQLDGTPWGVEAAARLVATLAEAAHAAHERGVIHRDLKPANVLLTDDGQLKIIDFGIAALVHPGALLTSEVVGTPAYMAPEQAAGKQHKLGPAMDIYALGAVLYELLTGRPPFRGGSAEETLRLVLHEEPVRPSVLRPGLPSQLEAACLQCLDKDPSRRPSSAAGLAKWLYLSLTEAARLGDLRTQGAGDLAALLRQRTQSEKAHRRYERLLSTLFETAGDWVILLDAQGHVLRTSPAVDELFGPAPPGATLRTWLGAGPDSEGGEAWLEEVAARALAGERVASMEAFGRPVGRPQGMWLAASARPLPGDDGAPDGAVLILEDVSERRALRDSEALYASLLETLPLYVFRKDLQGRFTFVNRAFCQMLGLPASRILGRTDHDLFPKSMADEYRQDDLLLLAKGEVFEKIEEHHQAACVPPCRCGRRATPAVAGVAADITKFFHVLLAPVYDAEGQLAGTQGAYWDVTPRILAERQAEVAATELRRVVAELKRSNADLEQFAFAASHDLQEPLRMVASFTQLLQRRYADRLDAEANEFIYFAVDGATRMQQLISDLLTYSRVTTRAQPLVQTPSRVLFDQAVRDLQAAIAESRAQITCGPLPAVWCDTTQLRQVFQNLIGNAIKFCRDRIPAVHVSAGACDGSWVFSVCDNGIGIEPRHAERIFAIFQRLHARDKYPGNGIGLALCKKIIDRHGGRVWVESQPGAGSVFSFSLPMEPPAEAAKAVP